MPDDGCTLALVCVLPGAVGYVVVHVGDSRVVVADAASGTMKTDGVEMGMNGGHGDEDEWGGHGMKMNGARRHGTTMQCITQGFKDPTCRRVSTHTNIPPITDLRVEEGVIPALIGARLFRREGVEWEGIVKSLGMVDALGDVVMKLEPRVFEGMVDVEVLENDGMDGVVVLASDGVWGCCGEGRLLEGGEEVREVLEGVGGLLWKEGRKSPRRRGGKRVGEWDVMRGVRGEEDEEALNGVGIPTGIRDKRKRTDNCDVETRGNDAECETDDGSGSPLQRRGDAGYIETLEDVNRVDKPMSTLHRCDKMTTRDADNGDSYDETSSPLRVIRDEIRNGYTRRQLDQDDDVFCVPDSCPPSDTDHDDYFKLRKV
ncbi:hypothetical protein BC829DRAFT_440400 [Chytridium lagenaria]|nr:hypothetical protein BC829DRAFT_440400 [Chytridium lagenaria]